MVSHESHHPQSLNIHGQSYQPEVCRVYHCSSEIAMLVDPLVNDPLINNMALLRIVALLDTALSLGQINEEQHTDELLHWMEYKIDSSIEE